MSAPTPNESEVVIQGIDGNLTTAALNYFQRLFRSRKNYRNFLHAQFTYDLYMWLFWMPFFFIAMVIWEEQIDRMIGTYPLAIRVALYVYGFFLFANLYRVVIGYLRWTWQTIELKDVRSTQRRHRVFWVGAFFAVLLPTTLRLLIK